MELGYVIVYVPDVAATVAFYERAFGIKRRFIHESGTYAEMETGIVFCR
jgi:lactoylglutathione lyase